MGPGGDTWKAAETACKEDGPKPSVRLWIEAARKQCRGIQYREQRTTEKNEYVPRGKVRRTRQARHGRQYKMT